MKEKKVDVMKPFRLMIVLAVGAIAGCASVPAPLEGGYSESFQPDQAGERSVGANVRWGGIVVETRPQAKRTCIEILAQELDRTARPVRSDRGYGRFIACRDEFIDPEIFVNGREVTVVGELTGFQEGKVGEFEYVYPVVGADAVYLWPERQEHYWYGHGYYNWGYPYYWPYYRTPYYYGGIGTRIYYPYPRGGYIHQSGSIQGSSNTNRANRKQ